MPICEKCGEDKLGRGFALHVKSCTGKIQTPLNRIEESKKNCSNDDKNETPHNTIEEFTKMEENTTPHNTIKIESELKDIRFELDNTKSEIANLRTEIGNIRAEIKQQPKTKRSLRRRRRQSDDENSF